MSLFITLFGGMALTAVLYGLGRMARLSNFWAAVNACALPVFAYLAWAFANRPSLDAITLHVVAYPTVSVLLFQLYGERRAGKAQMHWVPLMMMGMFVLLTVLMGGFVYIAKEGLPPALARMLLPGSPQTVHTGFAGVVAHHEEAAKSIAAQRAMDERLRQLGWNIAVQGLQDARAGQPLSVSVHIQDRDGTPLRQARVRMALSRPGAEADWLLLHGTTAGHFERQIPATASGTWIWRLSVSAQGETIHLERDIDLH